MQIIHDYMANTDGGSRLCLELAQQLGCQLHMAFVSKKHPFLQEYSIKVHTLFPGLRFLPQLVRQWGLAKSFAAFCPSQSGCHGPVCYSGSYAPLAVNQQEAGRRVLYCHTPPRFLYDAHEVFAKYLPAPAQFLFRQFCDWLRPQYEWAVSAMDIIVANSSAVKDRISKYLHRDSVVISPPCAVDTYQWDEPQNYYLSLSRLDSLKRIDLLISAFAQLPDRQLLICSDGPEKNALKKQAKGYANIHFVGTVSEAKRRELLANCIATICVARDEDFGLCAVESLAAGKPAIIAGAGGLGEIINNEETGFVLGADPAPSEICEAVQKCHKARAMAMRGACENAALKYSSQIFGKKMKEVLF